MAKNTVTFEEKVKGWTSFHSFFPNFMVGMNNSFFSFSGGDLYVHDSDKVPRNTFYGAQYPTKVSVMVNDAPQEIKELKAVSLEGNYPWDNAITAYISNIDDFTKSSLALEEFVQKEGIWYAYARRNENQNSYNSKSAYGIGVVQSITGSIIVVNGYSSSLTADDVIVRGTDLSVVGTVISSSTVQGITTIELSGVGSLIVGDFIIGKKDSRIEGGNLRGYTMRMDLEITRDNKVELFAVNSEVIKSFT